MRQLAFMLFLCLSGLSLTVYIGCSPEETNKNGLYDLSSLGQEEIAKGEKLFKLSCARCHGMQADGGNAPSLRRLNLTHAPDNEALFNVIQYGIPGTEMPGTWLLTPPDVRLVAGYVRSIGTVEEVEIQGDQTNGRTIFTQKGACSSCHIVNGKGGSLGPDLSRIGAKRSHSYLRQTILEPGFAKQEGSMPRSANGFTEYLVYSVKTKDDRQLMGMRVNEDAFTLQLRDAGNQFYSLRKSDLKEMKKEYGQSLMPSMKDVLSDTELNDLLAYLVSLK